MSSLLWDLPVALCVQEAGLELPKALEALCQQVGGPLSVQLLLRGTRRAPSLAGACVALQPWIILPAPDQLLTAALALALGGFRVPGIRIKVSGSQLLLRGHVVGSVWRQLWLSQPRGRTFFSSGD